VKPRGNACSKKLHIQSQTYPQLILNTFWRKICSRFSWIRHSNVQKVVNDYSFVQNPTIVNIFQQKQTIQNKIFCPSFSNLVHFADEQSQFCYCRRFWTIVQNFDAGLLEFLFQFEFTKFQYRIYLLLDNDGSVFQTNRIILFMTFGSITFVRK